MRLVRVFAQPGHLSSWLEQSPPLPQLLQYFGLKREKPQPEPVSVYRIDSEIEEVEAVAAVFLATDGSPEKRFGVILTDDDCGVAEVTLDLEERGTTGIQTVDGRHVNLKGTVDQFGRLIARIVQGMWEGEQRVRLYPAQQIAGQIAVFSKLPGGQIDPAARETCLGVLALKNWHTFQESSPAVEIRGTLKDKSTFSVIARRDC